MPQSLLDVILNYSGPISYFIIFGFLLACGLGLPVPEDITLFAAGLLAYYGNVNVHIVMGIAMAGVLIGDTIVYLLGHKYGDRIRKKRPFIRFLPDEQFKELKTRFKHKGNKVIFAGRFMPGLRAPIFFTAGSLHLPYKIFIFYDGLAALLSVPAIVYSVWFFGDHVDKVIKIIKRIQFGIAGTLVLIFILIALRYYFKYRQNQQRTL